MANKYNVKLSHRKGGLIQNTTNIQQKCTINKQDKRGLLFGCNLKQSKTASPYIFMYYVIF